MSLVLYYKQHPLYQLEVYMISTILEGDLGSPVRTLTKHITLNQIKCRNYLEHLMTSQMQINISVNFISHKDSFMGFR